MEDVIVSNNNNNNNNRIADDKSRGRASIGRRVTSEGVGVGRDRSGILEDKERRGVSRTSRQRISKGLDDIAVGVVVDDITDGDNENTPGAYRCRVDEHSDPEHEEAWQPMPKPC